MCLLLQAGNPGHEATSTCQGDSKPLAAARTAIRNAAARCKQCLLNRRFGDPFFPAPHIQHFRARGTCAVSCGDSHPGMLRTSGCHSLWFLLPPRPWVPPRPPGNAYCIGMTMGLPSRRTPREANNLLCQLRIGSGHFQDMQSKGPHAQHGWLSLAASKQASIALEHANPAWAGCPNGYS